MKPRYLVEEENKRRELYRQNVPAPVPLPEPPNVLHQDYRDVFALLDQKLLNHVRLNDYLRPNIQLRRKFIKNTMDCIEVDLHELKESYRARFVDPDFKSYCEKFIQSLKPLLLDFNKEVGFTGYMYSIRIRYKDIFSKNINVFIT